MRRFCINNDGVFKMTLCVFFFFLLYTMHFALIAQDVPWTPQGCWPFKESYLGDVIHHVFESASSSQLMIFRCFHVEKRRSSI